MSLARFNPDLHKLNVENYILVEQDDMRCDVFPQNETKSLFLAEGLNPCLGIVMHGAAQADDDEEEPDAFVILFHCGALTAGDLEKIEEAKEDKPAIINEFCKNSIVEIILRLDQWFDNNDIHLEKITIDGSSLIRCTQADTSNIQEEVANEFKRILDSPEEINELIEEDGIIEAEIEFGNYLFQSVEEPEQYKGSREAGDVDSIHVFLNSSETGLQIIYHKGFETVKNLLEEKAEQKIQTSTSSSVPVSPSRDNPWSRYSSSSYLPQSQQDAIDAVTQNNPSATTPTISQPANTTSSASSSSSSGEATEDAELDSDANPSKSRKLNQ